MPAWWTLNLDEKRASKDQTDAYKSRSWVPKFPNGGWVFIGMSVAFLALALFYGAIHSIQDLGATLLILIGV